MLLRLCRCILLVVVLLCAASLQGAARAAISFLPPVSYSKISAGPLEAADLDGDGKIDLAVASYDGGESGSVSVFYGRGDGTFESAVDDTVGNDLMHVIAADVNGDGRPDMLVAQRGASRVAVFLNQGHRTFATPVVSTVPGPMAIHARDLDGDGLPDLAVSCHYANKLAVLLNRGDGTFGPPAYYPAGSYTARIVSGDWNGDGKLDLAMANYESGNILLYLNDGTGKLTPSGDYHTGSYASGLLTDDFNRDGKPDLAVTNVFSNSLSVLFGDGTGVFRAPADYGGMAFPGFGASADLDGDGFPDLAVPSNENSYFTVYQNDGAGHFLAGLRFDSGGDDTRTLTMADFNGDGKPDVAVGHRWGNSISIFLNNTPWPAEKTFPPTPVSVPAPALRALALDPSTIVGGCGTTTGIVTLPTPAPPGGTVVRLASSNPAATVPATVTVPEGETRAPFTVATLPVTHLETGTITATWGGPQEQPVPAVSTQSYRINGAPYVASGPRETLTATFTQPDGGVTHSFYKGYVLLHVTGVGQSYGATYNDAFYLYTAPFDSPRNGHDGSYYQLTFGTSPLTAFNQGSNARNFLVGALPEYNPAHDYTFILDTRLSSPAQLHFGVSDGGFSDNTGAYTIEVTPLQAGTTPPAPAEPAEASQSAVLTVQPTSIAQVAITPGQIPGGQAASGQVTLECPAGPEGAVVTLTSSDPAAASAPETVTVPPGATTVGFTITTQPVAASSPVTFTAAFAGRTETASLTVTEGPPPPTVATFTLDPPAVVGSHAVTGVVTLTSPAGIDGALVRFDSDDWKVAGPPAAVGVSPGATSASFTVRTTAVTESSPMRLRASFGGSTAEAALMVLPLPPWPASRPAPSGGVLIAAADEAPTWRADWGLQMEQFVWNLAGYLTGGKPGKLLVYSRSGIFSPLFLDLLRRAGHTVSQTIAPGPLGAYDAIFTGGDADVDRQALADYVRHGGKLYVTTSSGNVPDEPAFWNVLLEPFGMRYLPRILGPYDSVTSFSDHPIFEGVERLVVSHDPYPIELLPGDWPHTRVLSTEHGVNWWAVAEIPALLPPPVPAAPSGLTVSDRTKGRLELRWTDNSADETGFEIERRSGSEAFTRIATAGAGVTQFLDSGLTAGTTYTYRVRAVNTAGASPYSEEASATLSSARPLPAAYRIEDLGSVTPWAINSAGHVAGERAGFDSVSAFLWVDGRLQDMHDSGHVSGAGGINDAGQVAGWSDAGGPVTRAALWSGVILQNLGLRGSATSFAYGINGNGDTVGWTQIPQTGPAQTAFVTRAGVITPLDPRTTSAAAAINDAGQIVGWLLGAGGHHAFLSSGGELRDLGALGGEQSEARGINNLGHVVGWSHTQPGSDERRAFLWIDGEMSEIGALPGYAGSQATGINDGDQIVGWASAPSGATEVAFVASGDTIQDLNALIPTDSGWTLQRAHAINASGQIVGIGLLDGQPRGFRLTPRSSAGGTGDAEPEPGISLTLDPSTVTAGQNVTATVTLARPAPAGGADVLLLRDRAAPVWMTDLVTVPEGQTTAQFLVGTQAVESATAVCIIASVGGERRSATLTLVPAAPAITGTPAQTSRPGISVTLSPTAVTAGASSIRHIAVFRPSTREWLLRAEDGSGHTIPFGGPGDQPVPADYLGTGTAQIAVFRPSTREWFIRTEDGRTLSATWGGPGDIPVPGDYLELHRAQIAVFRPSTRQWFIRRDDGSPVIAAFGGPGDIPVPGDYFGLKRTQIAVFRPHTGEWFVRRDDGTAAIAPWGGPGDIPVPADYLGLGRLQIAVYRPGTSEFFLRDDLARATQIQFGSPGDVPVPFDYQGTGHAQIAVYRPGTGDWLVREDSGEQIRIPWGGPEDRPVPAGFADGTTAATGVRR